MGVKLSKKENPLVVLDFDGQSGDYEQTAETYTHPFGPDWVLGKSELEAIKCDLKALDELPGEKIPIFSLQGHIIPARCFSVFDGDTINAVFKYEEEYIRMRFRMIGYNSNEIRGGTEETRRKAKEARDYLADRLLDKKVLLYLGDFDKYGRPLCDVYLIESELNLCNAFSNHINKEMIEKGYGEIYMPRK